MTISLPRPKKPLFDVFDLTNLTWSQKETFGEPKVIPGVGNGSTLSYHRDTHSLYLYGGWNDEDFSSDIYCVSMDTWKWEKVHMDEGDIQPSPRYLTAVTVHGDKLCNFGGVGGPIRPNQDVGAEYRVYVHGVRVYQFGWNNEYYEFDVKSSKLIAKRC